MLGWLVLSCRQRIGIGVLIPCPNDAHDGVPPAFRKENTHVE
jgi:hypothetical protein